MKWLIWSRCWFQRHLPGDVDCHVLLGGTGEHPEQLIQGGGQELDHHMTLHGVQTLTAQTSKAHVYEEFSDTANAQLEEYMCDVVFF